MATIANYELGSDTLRAEAIALHETRMEILTAIKAQAKQSNSDSIKKLAEAYQMLATLGRLPYERPEPTTATSGSER